MKVAEPSLKVPVPSTFLPFIKEVVSPSGGAGVTTAVKVTTSPYVDGFGEEVSVVVVASVPLPVSETVCGLFPALSVKVKVPVSNPTAWGVNVTSTSQWVPGFTPLAHLFTGSAKFPLIEMSVIVLSRTIEISRLKNRLDDREQQPFF